LYRAARKLGSNGTPNYRNSCATKPSSAAASRCTIPSVGERTVVCDFDGGLLRSTFLFPYFMLMACEGGSLIRALLLLCSFPLVWVMGEHSDASVQVMAFVTFVGLRPRDTDLVARAVLPKFFIERLNAHVYDQLWLPARRKVAVTSAPRVMAEWFLKEYMAADVVVGRELQMIKIRHGSYFTGLLYRPGPGMRQKDPRELLGADGAMADVAVVGTSNPLNHLFIPYCKVRTYVCAFYSFSFN
jgi:glycerol-3-phosphate acyltransferase